MNYLERLKYLSYLSPPLALYNMYNDYKNLDAKHRWMIQTFVAGLPVIGDLYRSHDNMRYMEDYINNRGLDWKDIKYPTRTQGMQGLGSVVNYVSRNIERLYV